MWKCPVCDTKNPQLKCKTCGFDGSCDYERHPTLAAIQAPGEAVSRRSVRIRKKYEGFLRCPHCGSVSFGVRLADRMLVCLDCDAATTGLDAATDVKVGTGVNTTADTMIDLTEHFAGMKIMLRSVQNGKYLCADVSMPNAPAMCNRDVGSDWETFEVSPVTANGWVGLWAVANNQYLSTSVFDTNAPVNAIAGVLLRWEMFRIFMKDKDFYIQSRENGKWLSARVNLPGAPVAACGEAPSLWERFKIIVVEKDAEN